jgi:hypothetical protein
LAACAFCDAPAIGFHRDQGSNSDIPRISCAARVAALKSAAKTVALKAARYPLV